MAQRNKNSSRQELLEIKLSELAGLVQDIAPQARVEISHERYEDEDAHVYVYPPTVIQEAEIESLELALGERCNEILLDTGLFIVGAVCN